MSAGTAQGGKMQYSLDGKTFSASIPKATKPGTYTVWYKVVGDSNHTDTGKKSVKATVTEPDTVNTTAVAHVQNLGWMAWAKGSDASQIIGTTGKSLRLEAVQVVIQRKGSKAPATTLNGATQSYGKAFVVK